jgi:hypothetical protein
MRRDNDYIEERLHFVVDGLDRGVRGFSGLERKRHIVVAPSLLSLKRNLGKKCSASFDSIDAISRNPHSIEAYRKEAPCVSRKYLRPIIKRSAARQVKAAFDPNLWFRLLLEFQISVSKSKNEE